jgi:Holliday junction DNA helicase RuvA
MISFLEGILFKKEGDKVVVLAQGVGYEVLLPSIVSQALAGRRSGEDGDRVKLHIFYHQSEHQPKPVLVGFNTEVEKEFFEKFIKVEAIGPTAAVKALTMPVSTIARAIEEKDTSTLQRLKGIGKRTADKIVATLQGKVGKFALVRDEQMPAPPVEPEDLRRQVEEVLVKQLGHTRSEAARMVSEAMAQNPAITSPEELFEEVYRGQSK